MAKKERQDPREKQAARIIEIIETDLAAGETTIMPWQKTWGGEHLMPQNVRGNVYRGSNLMLLAFAPYTLPAFLTYNQALEHGGIVKKGEGGWPVVYWKIWDEEKDDDGKTRNRPPSMFGTTVFNIEQCEAITVERVEAMRAQVNSNHGKIAFNARKALEKLGIGEDADVEKAVAKLAKKWESLTKKIAAKAEGPKRKHNPIKAAEKIHAAFQKQGGPKVKHEGARPFYRPSTDSIVLPPLSSFDSAEEYHTTRFHEEVHSTGHKDRLNRDELMTDNKMFGDHNYSEEELTAEFGASMLASVAGIAAQTERNSVAYIRGWLKRLKNDPSMLYKAASRAQKATDLILNKKFNEKANEKAA